MIFQNPGYVNPNQLRRDAKKAGAEKYTNKIDAQKSLKIRKKENPGVERDPLDSVFLTEESQVKEEVESDEEEWSEDESRKEAEKLKRQIEKKRRPKRKRGKKKNDNV